MVSELQFMKCRGDVGNNIPGRLSETDLVAKFDEVIQVEFV